MYISIFFSQLVNDICMCVNKQFVYVDLLYDEISLTFTAGSVRLSWYPICCGSDCDACNVVFCCMCVCYETVRVTVMLVWGTGGGVVAVSVYIWVVHVDQVCFM